MATTTTNFGWDIPQSTDLVKDGATAIAALGQDIDTAFIDLKGGTSGQVLAKASGTDLDFSWVAQDDSNAIQNAIVDAKGDLIGATAADTPARLAVGTNGQVLTADSAEATGLKWATASGGFTYAAYTPTFTNFTLGNGTINIARWAQSGKMVHVYGIVTLGSTSSVSGSITVALPVTAASSPLGFVTGVGQFGDDGVGNYGAVAIRASTTTLTINAQKSDGTYTLLASTSSTVPFTWATNDDFRWSLVYEAA
jgi:hypothetical protein